MLVSALLILATLATAQSIPPPVCGTSRVRIHPKGQPGWCLAIEDAVWPWKFGQWALIRKCKFDRGYVWTIKGSARTQVQVENTSWCLNAGTIPNVNWFPKNGAEAQTAYCRQWTEEPGNAIAWYYEGGALRYTSQKTFCLDNEGGKLVEGNKVQIWECAPGNGNQQWEFEYL